MIQHNKIIAAWFLILLVGVTGCIGLDDSNSTSSPVTQPDSPEHEQQKLTSEVKRSIEVSDGSESIVIKISVNRGLSKREYKRTVSAVENQTMTLRSASIDNRIITARARADQIRDLTELESVNTIDTVNMGAPDN